jgi:hypothetical protein
MTRLAELDRGGWCGHLPFLTEGDAAKSKMPEIGFCPAIHPIENASILADATVALARG